MTTGEIDYKIPEELYEENEPLITYFEGNESIWFVDSEYDQPTFAMFSSLGVADFVRVQRRHVNCQRDVTIVDWHGEHKRGLQGFDLDLKVEGLDYSGRTEWCRN